MCNGRNHINLINFRFKQQGQIVLAPQTCQLPNRPEGHKTTSCRSWRNAWPLRSSENQRTWVWFWRPPGQGCLDLLKNGRLTNRKIKKNHQKNKSRVTFLGLMWSRFRLKAHHFQLLIYELVIQRSELSLTPQRSWRKTHPRSGTWAVRCCHSTPCHPNKQHLGWVVGLYECTIRYLKTVRYTPYISYINHHKP